MKAWLKVALILARMQTGRSELDRASFPGTACAAPGKTLGNPPLTAPTLL
jgi:hypothetical protein